MTGWEIAWFLMFMGLSIGFCFSVIVDDDKDWAWAALATLVIAGAIALISTHDSLANLGTHENEDQVFGCIQDKVAKSVAFNADGNVVIQNTDGTTTNLAVANLDPDVTDTANQQFQAGKPYCSNPTWAWHTAGTLEPTKH